MDFFNQNSMNFDAPSKDTEEKEPLSTEVSDDDYDNCIEDEFGVLYSADGKRLLEAREGKGTSTHYCIKEGTEVICDFAFEHSDIYHVELPASITTIGNNPFEPHIDDIVSKSSRFVVQNGMLIDSQKGRLISFLEYNEDEGVIFPESVKIIGSYAFCECDLPDKLILPSTITTIEESAFYDPWGKELVLPSSLTNVEYSPFEYHNNLPLHIISESSRFVLQSNMLLDLQEGRVITYLRNGEKYEKNIIVPESIKSIEPYAFYKCDLERITLPSSLINIGEYAFDSCTCYEINLPSSLESIGNFAFDDCYRLQKLTLPASLTSIGDDPFSSVEKIESESPRFIVQNKMVIDLLDGRLISVQSSEEDINYDIPEIVKSIGNYVFKSKDIGNLSVPDSITNIGDYAFENANIEEFKMPASLVSIGNHAFENTNLDEVTFPETLTSIGDYAFHNTSLEELTLPSSITSIGKHTFQGTYLNEVTLPSFLTSIGDYAFEGTSLVELTLPSTLTSIGSHAFEETPLDELSIPESLTYIGEYAFKDTSLEEVSFPDSFTTIGRHVFEGTLFEKIDFPKSLEKIEECAFSKCEYLEEVILPPSVKSIGEGAFSDCGKLAKVDLPDSLLSIGGGAFSDCKSLINITLPSSLVSIGDNPFRNIFEIKIESKSRQFAVRDGMLIDTKAGTLISYFAFKRIATIPKSVSSIGKNAFYNCCDLEIVIIPPLVKSISKDAFGLCPSLKMLIIPKGTKKKFKSMLPKALSEILYEKEFPIDGTMPKYSFIDGIRFFFRSIGEAIRGSE
ncbi:MAG: leucine-rich repeat domain-containing protein [Bacteroidales bacterium]|nr:leucine-rich repeat domain-containing protein [Bacteroidales bacterium]